MDVLIVDDHVLFAKSLKTLLVQYEDISVIDLITSAADIDKAIATYDYDVIIMDINMGDKAGTDGLSLAEELIHRDPMLKIIILTGYDLPIYKEHAQKIGVKAFINKNAEPVLLHQTLQDVAENKTLFRIKSPVNNQLTKKEVEVLNLLCSGKKRADIAKELYISERTLYNHIFNIYEKLEVTNNAEAMHKALQLGYLRPSSTDF